MIILDFFRENYIGFIKSIDIYAYRTGFLFESEDERTIGTKDLVIKGRLINFDRREL